MRYDNENLRAVLNQKEEEIANLNDQFDLRGNEMGDQDRRIKELEDVIQDLEEKNKKFVDLLNQQIFKKAENYKERVINKL